MALTKEQEALYRRTMIEARRQLEGFDDEMKQELERIRRRLGRLQESKEHISRFYCAAAALLGITVEEKAPAVEDMILPKN